MNIQLEYTKLKFMIMNGIEGPWDTIAAELYAELLKSDILWSDAQRIAQICKLVEDNDIYFLNLLS